MTISHLTCMSLQPKILTFVYIPPPPLVCTFIYHNTQNPWLKFLLLLTKIFPSVHRTWKPRKWLKNLDPMLYLSPPRLTLQCVCLWPGLPMDKPCLLDTVTTPSEYGKSLLRPEEDKEVECMCVILYIFITN